MKDRLLNSAEIAERLAVPESWVREQTRALDGIPHLRLGRYVRFEWDDVRGWLDAHTAGDQRWRRHRPKAS